MSPDRHAPVDEQPASDGPEVFNTGTVEEAPDPAAEDNEPKVWRQKSGDGSEAVGGTVGTDRTDDDVKLSEPQPTE